MKQSFAFAIFFIYCYLLFISHTQGQGKCLTLLVRVFRDESKEIKNVATQKRIILLASEGGFVCENGWLLYRDQCYLFTTYARNWYAARQECQDLGLDADLAQIRVPEVDAFLLSKKITSCIVFQYVFRSFCPFSQAKNFFPLWPLNQWWIILFCE